MRRIHGIELEDTAWLPTSLRDATTDYLQTTLLLTNPYRSVLPKLQHALDHLSEHQIIDLGAGGGGPWVRLLPQLAEGRTSPHVLLTDKYPNTAALQAVAARFPSHIAVHSSSVDATNVPSSLRGFRTMFSSFHHFPPDQARVILADAVRQGQGIGIFEATKRETGTIAGMAITPLLSLLFTPLARPFRWSRLLWSYVLPFQPFVVLFDGVVSCLRTYTPAELRDMVGSVSGAESYTWDIGETQGADIPIPITYLIGYPT